MEKYYCKNCKITMEGITGDRECPECESIMVKVEPNTYKFETNNMQNRIREEWKEQIEIWKDTPSPENEGEATEIVTNWWLSKIDELLKSQRDEERLRSAKIVEELMEDSEHWQPIASRIMERVIIGKEDLYLIKNN